MFVENCVRAGLLVGISLSWAAAATVATPATAHLSAAQIVEKHVAARGGLSAWHAVQTMSWSGTMEAGAGDSAARSAMWVQNEWAQKNHARKAPAGASTSKGAPQSTAEPPKQVALPFVLDLKRPGKSRVEIEFAGKKAVQVYDGAQGWKLRPFLNRTDVEPFTREEAKFTEGKWNLDDPMMDYAAQGTKVEFDGIDPVDGHQAYKLKLTLKNGEVQHIWIDTQSFLDVKVEGSPRRMDGKVRTVWITQRDFRSVQGLKIPFELETTVDGYASKHKMSLEKVTLNPSVDEKLFAKPEA
jgi:outer membrane lipoprotein-sorting protein